MAFIKGWSGITDFRAMRICFLEESSDQFNFASLAPLHGFRVKDGECQAARPDPKRS
jgi:hypothetical protein